MRDVEHAPVLNDFPILAAPPVTVTHEDAFACRFETEKWLHVHTRDHPPAVQEGVISISCLAIGCDAGDPFILAISPAIESGFKWALEFSKGLYSLVGSETPRTVLDHAIVPVGSPGVIFGCKLLQHTFDKVG